MPEIENEAEAAALFHTTAKQLWALRRRRQSSACVSRRAGTWTEAILYIQITNPGASNRDIRAAYASIVLHKALHTMTEVFLIPQGKRDLI